MIRPLQKSALFGHSNLVSTSSWRSDMERPQKAHVPRWFLADNINQTATIPNHALEIHVDTVSVQLNLDIRPPRYSGHLLIMLFDKFWLHRSSQIQKAVFFSLNISHHFFYTFFCRFKSTSTLSQCFEFYVYISWPDIQISIFSNMPCTQDRLSIFAYCSDSNTYLFCDVLISNYTNIKLFQ